MIRICIVACLLNTAFCFGQQNLNIEIDNYMDALIDRQGIPGVALAVIKDQKVIHQKNYGYANLEHQVPVSDQSIFRVYSLTKLIVSVGIFQLIESKKLRLEDKISKYVPDLPESWQSIRIKHLLAHSSGLPDMAPIPDFKDLSEQEAADIVFSQARKFPAGDQYDYNQTGFWLLKKVIEKIEDTPMDSWIMNHQFQPASDTAFFSSDSRDIVLHRATPYFPFTKNALTLDHSYLQGTYAHAQNGLNISLNEFINWDKRLRDNALISAKTKALMWETYPYSASDKAFTYGWDKRMVGNKESFGFSGSLVTAYRIFPDDDLSIVFLSNGLTRFYNIEEVVNDIAGMVFEGE